MDSGAEEDEGAGGAMKKEQDFNELKRSFLLEGKATCEDVSLLLNTFECVGALPVAVCRKILF